MDQFTPHPAKPTIVLVEDDASLLSALGFALGTYGFAVHAFARAGALLAAPVQADCIVVDMRLPDMDGLTLVKRLRERNVWAPVILTTTNPDARTRRAAEAMGVPIVEKPLITEELLARIEEIILESRR